MPSDAVTLIMSDHRVMEGLFKLLKDPSQDRAALVEEVYARLKAHSEAEEQHVYPALAKADPSEKEDVHHGTEEHHEAEEMCAKLRGMQPGTPEFESTLDEFIEAVTHHVEEEETEILPDLARTFDRAKLEELGRKFEERRLGELVARGYEPAISAGTTGGIDELTREELYEKAKEADIPGRSSMTKEELVSALQDAQAR